jgi:hypothetical protein
VDVWCGSKRSVVGLWVDVTSRYLRLIDTGWNLELLSNPFPKGGNSEGMRQ